MSLHQLWYDQNVPPVVREVRVARGTNPPYSIPTGSGEQLRTVHVAGPNRIKVRFSEGVNFSTLLSAITVRGKTHNPYTLSGTIEWLGGGVYEATWTLSSTAHPNGFEWTNAGKVHRGDQIMIKLDNALLRKPAPANTVLDGLYTNPTSLGQGSAMRLPSGDGFVSPGQDFYFYVTILAGDTNRDNVVNLIDFNTVKDNLGLSPATYEQGDVDGDGAVTLADFNIVKDNLGLDWTTWQGPTQP